MTQPDQPDIERLARCAQTLAEKQSVGPLDTAASQAHIQGVLFGEKDVWGAFQEGLLTRQEVCDKVLAEISTWVYQQTKLETEPTGWRDPAIKREVAQALLGVDAP